MAESKKKPIQQKAQIIETALREAVTEALSGDFDPNHFIPYVQMFELEALLFTDPKIMAEVLGNPALEKTFQAMVQAAGGCELIDDGVETAPSKRIAHHASYRKGSGVNAQTPIIVQRIGIGKVRAKCPHFHEWVSRLESLTENPPPWSAEIR